MKKEYKEGVDFVFEQNPELAKIGSQEDYSEYIKTIFPESKVKDIVYHGTEAKIDSFKENQHFGTLKAARNRIRGVLDNEALYSAYYDGSSNFIKKFKDEHSKYYAVLLNINDIKHVKDGVKIGWEKDLIEKDKINSFEYINNFEDKKSKSYIIRKPEQIHILGSQEDSEGFKEFIKEKSRGKNSLEGKVVSGFFILSFLAGLVLIPASLTGNIIGTLGTAHKLIGIILFLLGISGFFVYNKLRS